MTPSPFLTRVVLHNYKSIAACDVRLGALTYLVGPNGAGKSNFLDALRFVADALSNSLENAVAGRGGLAEILHQGAQANNYIGIRLDFHLPDGQSVDYAFTVQFSDAGALLVHDERCRVTNESGQHSFQVSEGQLVLSSEPMPAISPDRLALVSASGSPTFRPVFDALVAMNVYQLNPQRMRELQKPQDGRSLKSDGGNIASALAYLEHAEPQVFDLIQAYLHAVVPAVDGVLHSPIGHMETLIFQQHANSDAETRFYANSMSDGTLRALGLLTALFQGGATSFPRLIGIEEPETALHPAAFAVLREAMVRAAERSQVIVTSHSPDLLDDPELDPDALLAVTSEHGATRIARLDEASRTAMKTHLFSAGELLRLNQLAPDHASLAQQSVLPDLWSNVQP